MLFTSYNRGNNQQFEKIHESHKATTNIRINDVNLATIYTNEITKIIQQQYSDHNQEYTYVNMKEETNILALIVPDDVLFQKHVVATKFDIYVFIAHVLVKLESWLFQIDLMVLIDN